MMVVEFVVQAQLCSLAEQSDQTACWTLPLDTLDHGVTQKLLESGGRVPVFNLCKHTDVPPSVTTATWMDAEARTHVVHVEVVNHLLPVPIRHAHHVDLHFGKGSGEYVLVSRNLDKLLSSAGGLRSLLFVGTLVPHVDVVVSETEGCVVSLCSYCRRIGSCEHEGEMLSFLHPHKAEHLFDHSKTVHNFARHDCEHRSLLRDSLAQKLQ
mmetsp:Transcript_47295/g.93328  ORF Transcript_47295/g.93328 Transcript_47295/m.93328 type:complete len:210 (-) Transcript_47295:101-730(-)